MDTQSSRIDDEIASQTPGKSELTYEETPPIDPLGQTDVRMSPPPKPHNPVISILTTIIFFIILFIIGFWLSGFVRTYMGIFLSGKKEVQATPTPTPKLTGGILSPTPTLKAENVWKTYQVLNGKTKQPFDGISYTLPTDVISPICDGSTCRSQGTYLPGGTRFTVALRGEGQVLPDFRGRIISDLKGIPFPVTETTIQGLPATEFQGTFIGTTVGGYVFSQMRGYMIPITETVSFEINHFTPSGIVTDFVSDDALFDTIVDSLVLPGSSLEKGSVSSPSATPATE